MSFHNELSSTIQSILLPCLCLLSHPLNVEYVLSDSTGFSLSLILRRQLADKPFPFLFLAFLIFSSFVGNQKKKPVTPLQCTLTAATSTLYLVRDQDDGVKRGALID